MKLSISKVSLAALLLTYVSFSPLIPPVAKLLFFMVGLLLFIKRFPVPRKIDFVYYLFISYVLVSFFVDFYINDFSSQVSYVGAYFILGSFLGFLIARSKSNYEISNAIEKVVFYFALLSVIGIVVYTFLPSVLSILPSYEYKFTSHKTIGFTNILTTHGMVIQRNPGFTTEPGVFQFLLNIGLLIHIHNKGKHYSFFKVVLYTLLILSTKSTSGVLTLFVVYVYLFFVLSNRDRVIIIALLLISAPFLYSIIDYHTSVKLNISDRSLQGRLEPAVNILSEHVTWFGKGNSFYDANVAFLDIGSYDSYTQLLVRYGVVGLVLFILSFVLFSKAPLVIRLALVATCFSQTVWFSPLVSFIAFYFDSSAKRRPKLVESKSTFDAEANRGLTNYE